MRVRACRVPEMIVAVYFKDKSVVFLTVGVLNSSCRIGKDGIGAGVGMDSLPVEASP